MGYHPDTTAAIVVQVWDKKEEPGSIARNVSLFCRDVQNAVTNLTNLKTLQYYLL